MDKPESSYAQVRIFATRNMDKKFQQFVYVNYKLEEFIYLFDLKISVDDNVFANKRICNVL